MLDGSYVSVEYASQQKLPKVVEQFDSDVPDLVVVTGESPSNPPDTHHLLTHTHRKSPGLQIRRPGRHSIRPLPPRPAIQRRTLSHLDSQLRARRDPTEGAKRRLPAGRRIRRAAVPPNPPLQHRRPRRRPMGLVTRTIRGPDCGEGRDEHVDRVRPQR